MLATELIDRLFVRIANPRTRTDMPGRKPLLTDTHVFTVKTLFGDVAAQWGINHDPRSEPAPDSLATPASSEDIENAETRLGFPLPDDLRHLYGTIANGGFGPGSGIIPLDELVTYYEALRMNPPGEGGQPWPAHLLAFNRYDICCDCYDVSNGAIVFWDEETLLDGPGDCVWQRSFTKAAESLSAYLEAWLETEPPKPDQRYINAADTGFPDSDVVIDLWTLNHLRQSVEMLRQSPDHREMWGLPREGWEEALCKAQGLDPEVYLEMLKRPASDEF